MNGLQKPVRCRACGQRVTHGLSVCPHCGHNPIQFHTRWRATSLSVLIGVIVGLALFPFAPHPSALSSALTVTDTPHPLAIARPTFTPTVTATPLPTATTTNTPTASPSPTATPTVAKVALSAPTATSTASATPRPTVEPPRLVSPKDQIEFGGEDAEVILTWEGTLQEGQQFAVTARYIGKADETKTVGSWLRETRWRVPNSVFKDISITLRALKWDVTIIDAGGNALSAPSESRIFYWR